MNGLNVLMGLIPVIVTGIGVFILFRKGKSDIIKSIFNLKKEENINEIENNKEESVKVVAKIKKLEDVSKENKEEIKRKIKKTNKEIEEIIKENKKISELSDDLLEEW
jgi:seryl-tRNA synthetase